MLKLELDWAGESPAPVGVDADDELVRVEQVSEAGPSGWPVIAVYVACEEGEPAYLPYMRLVGWLRDVYGASEEEAEELQDLTKEV